MMQATPSSSCPATLRIGFCVNDGACGERHALQHVQDWFKKILNGEQKEKNDWLKHEQPAVVDTLRDGAILARGLIIDHQDTNTRRSRLCRWSREARWCPPRQVRAHGREIAVQIATSRDLEVVTAIDKWE